MRLPLNMSFPRKRESRGSWRIPRWIPAFAGMTVWIIPFFAQALPILADISSHRVEIHTSFTDTQLLVFGARNDPGDVVVVIRGPERNFMVRKKERVAGLWINKEQKEIPSTPEFYRIASSRKLDEVRQFLLFDSLQIEPPYSADKPANMREALYDMLAEEQLYARELGTIEFMGPTLFKAVFDFPDNMPRGTYTAEAYLFTDGALSGTHVIPVEVYKIGSDALIFDAAQNYSLLYGLFSVLLALGIGGGTSCIFKRIG